MSKSKVFSTISLVLTVIILGILIIGQMVGWYRYLIYLILVIIIGKVYMKGISFDEKRKDALGELIKREKYENGI